MANIERLLQLAQLPNAAEEISTEEAQKIADQVVLGYDEDNESRKDWLERAERAMDAALQITLEKTTPWVDASNVTYPALTVAALQFQARCYPAIIKDHEVVKPKVIGRDDDNEKSKQGQRVANHMNYQLLEQMPEWEDQFDKITLSLPIEGCEFKKNFFDANKGRNVSEWIRPKDFVVDYYTKTLEDCPRKTHVFERYPHQIRDKVDAGLYSDHEDLFNTDDDKLESTQTLLEQHFLYDLDDDGVKEPWIAVVHKEKKKLLRLVRGFELEEVMVRIGGNRQPLMELMQGGASEIPEELSEMMTISAIPQINYFTKYSFIPSPDGGFYDIGFGHLIGPLMDTVDTLINQLVDAGTLSNLQGGFYDKGLRGPKGDIRLKLNEWKPVQTSLNIKLSDHFYQPPVRGPSTVLFTLVDFLLGAVKDMTAVKDVLTGDAPAGMAEGSILAIIEQGLQVYSSIYKRIYRCLKAEIKVIYTLNSVFLKPEEYFQVLDDGSDGVISMSDYKNDGTDVVPVADPSASTKMQEMAKAQFLMQFIGNPKFNQDEIYNRVLSAGGFGGVDRLLITDDQMPPPQPDPAMIAMAENLQSETAKNMKQIEELEAKITNLNAKSIESLAKAEAQEAGVQLDEYKTQMEELRTNHEHFERMKGFMNEQTGVQTMENPAGNSMVLPNAGGGEIPGS